MVPTKIQALNLRISKFSLNVSVTHSLSQYLADTVTCSLIQPLTNIEKSTTEAEARVVDRQISVVPLACAGA